MPVTRRTNAQKVTTLSVDFTNVKDGGGRGAHVPEGDYVLKLKEAEVVPTKKDPNQLQVKWTFTIVKGPGQSKDVIYHYTGLSEERSWTTRNLLAALLEKDIPKKALNLDLAKYFGVKEIGATLVDGEPYNGKVKSEIADVFPASQYDDSGLTESDNEESDDEDSEEDEDEIDVDDDLD